MADSATDGGRLSAEVGRCEEVAYVSTIAQRHHCRDHGARPFGFGGSGSGASGKIDLAGRGGEYPLPPRPAKVTGCVRV